jgi:hypothetical protein
MKVKSTLAFGALGAMALVGVAVGAIPGSDGTISACYQKPGLLKNPGAVRVIDREAGQNCRGDEVAFAWDKTDRVYRARVTRDAGVSGDAASATYQESPETSFYRVQFPVDLGPGCAATAGPPFLGPTPVGGGGDPMTVIEASVLADSDEVRVRPRDVSNGADIRHAFELVVAC